MKRHSQSRAFAPIAIGLLGMAAYQVIVHTSHPAAMENDFFHGVWFGVCIGLELVGIYLLAKNKRGSAD